MTDFRMRLIIETILKDEKLLRQLQKDIEGLEPASKKGSKGLKGFVDNINAMKGQILAAGAVLVGFGLAVKKTFDFAREGAAIKQMGESFDLFLKQAGNVPNLLDDLKFAAHGTISDFNLMSSTMTLVMGATGALKEELLEATPQLLEMAKAANKLNPALGSVEFLYESLARGIKRASPLILDNLGVIIKVGEAYQTFADKMGISIKAMTAVQKTQAVLQAALLAGDALIDQVGGTTDALTDSYDRLTTHIINSKNAFLAWLSEAVNPVIVALDILAFGNLDIRAGVERLTRAVIAGTISFDEYNRILDKTETLTKSSNLITDLSIITREELNLQLEGSEEVQLALMGAMLRVTQAEIDEIRETERLDAVLQGIREESFGASQGLEGMAASIERIKTEKFERELEELTVAIADARIEYEKAREEFTKDPFSGIDTGLLSRVGSSLDSLNFAQAGGQGIQDFMDSVDTAMFDEKITEEQGEELFEAIFIAATQLDEQLGEITLDEGIANIMSQFQVDEETATELMETLIPIGVLESRLKEAEQETKILIGGLVAGIAAGVEGAQEKYDEIFAGVLTTSSEVTRELAEMFGLAEDDIFSLSGSFDTLTSHAKLSEDQIIEIQEAINALTNKEITITINYVSTGTPPPGGDAHGAVYDIPQGFPNDSFFLPLNVQSGEVVTVTPEGRTPPVTASRGGEININAPIYFNSEANMTLEEMVAAAIPRGNI